MVTDLNTQVDLAVKANSFINPIDPKQGVMAIGNNGVEFRASNGVGYIQIPWDNIVQVRAEVYRRGKYIRSFDIITDSNQTLNFVAADAIDALKAMRVYLNKDQMIQAPSHFKNMFKRKKKR